MRKKMTRYICAFLAMLMLLGTVSAEPVSAAVPPLDALITRENVLSLLQEYDKDAAYLMRTMSKSGDDILKWWYSGSSLVEDLPHAVHEETHSYSVSKIFGCDQKIYLGKKKYLPISYTEVFRSRIMGNTIPEEMRTFRWNVYVGNPDPKLSSDVNGVYGLLNEFTAYYWGMHTSLSLFDYFKDQNASPRQWLIFVTSCANNRQAYAEFKYYTLHYMQYAKQHKKGVYKKILKNKDYLKAFNTIEERYASLIAQFDEKLDELVDILQEEGHEVLFEESEDLANGGVSTSFEIDNIGTSLFDGPYLKLVREMEKPRYQKIFSVMKNKAK